MQMEMDKDGVALGHMKGWLSSTARMKTYNTENSELPGDSITALAIERAGEC